MNWLLHNPVTNIYSEYLLVFYAMAIAAVILACYKSVRSADRTGRMEPPPIPTRLDPYELAYLRGGEREVTRIAIISLRDRGLLQITESRDWSSTDLVIRKSVDRGRKPEPGELSPVEACIMKWTSFPAVRRQIYEPGGIPDLLREMCGDYRESLADQELLAPRGMEQLGVRLWWIGSALILGLGGYLLAVALAKAEPIVAVVLCPMALIGAIALAPACLEFPRISHRGQAYLEQLEFAYDRLASTGRRSSRSESVVTKGGSLDRGEPMRESSVYSDRLLMDGIFGEVSRAETPFTNLEAAMFPDGTSGGEDTIDSPSVAEIWERGKIGRSG
jgi:uncharacterized protein (TIGR04222 family)